MFGQLYFTSLQVNADWPAALQLFSGPGKPCVQLIQCVLELTQTQQSTLQLMLVAAQGQSQINTLLVFSLSILHDDICLHILTCLLTVSDSKLSQRCLKSHSGETEPGRSEPGDSRHTKRWFRLSISIFFW